MANTAPTPKAVTLVLVPALMLMLAFAFFYVGAFHDPTPHHVPLAVIGPPAVSVQLKRCYHTLRELGDDALAPPAASSGAARRASSSSTSRPEGAANHERADALAA